MRHFLEKYKTHEEPSTNILKKCKISAIPARGSPPILLTTHNIVNTSETEKMKLYTIYSPAEHPDGTIHETKAEADVGHH